MWAWQSEELCKWLLFNCVANERWLHPGLYFHLDHILLWNDEITWILFSECSHFSALMRSCLRYAITQNLQSGHFWPTINFAIIAILILIHLNWILFSLESSAIWAVPLNFPLLWYHPLFLRVTGMSGMSTWMGVLARNTQISYPSAQTRTLHLHTHKHSTENTKCLPQIIHASYSGCSCQIGEK